MSKKEKFDQLYNDQIARFEKRENEKKLFKEKVKELVESGIPRILAISYAKHGMQ
jgi:hypothetical protein